MAHSAYQRRCLWNMISAVGVGDRAKRIIEESHETGESRVYSVNLSNIQFPINMEKIPNIKIFLLVTSVWWD